jgi:hypothetical protein
MARRYAICVRPGGFDRTPKGQKQTDPFFGDLGIQRCGLDSGLLCDFQALVKILQVNNMPVRTSNVRNDYRCSIEKNQGGKYCVRIRVHYPRHAWSLGVFFLASSFDRAMKKLEESLDFLQRHEEKLWFWGVDRAEDMGFSAEFLREVGMKLDKRVEFPRKSANLAVVPEKSVPASVLGPMRRGLAESFEMTPRTANAAD